NRTKGVEVQRDVPPLGHLGKEIQIFPEIAEVVHGCAVSLRCVVLGRSLCSWQTERITHSRYFEKCVAVELWPIGNPWRTTVSVRGSVKEPLTCNQEFHNV